MAPERQRHLLVKGAVFRALGDAVTRAGLPCTVFPDGATVVIDNEHAREPDAAVECGMAGDPDTMILEAPLIVVEVAWPSESSDTEDKLVESLSVPSIQHYLMVNPTKKVVVHHARGQGGRHTTHIASSGEIDLTPPGMTVPVAELLPEVG